MKRIKKIFILSFLVIVFLFSSSQALAYDFQKRTGLETTGQGAGYAVDTQKAETYLPERIGTIISVILEFVGVIFLVLMIYGGYLWMTASGNEEQITKAKGIIARGLIGLIIIMLALSITWFVFGSGLFFQAIRPA